MPPFENDLTQTTHTHTSEQALRRLRPQQLTQLLRNSITNFLRLVLTTNISSPDSTLNHILDCLVDGFCDLGHAERVFEHHGHG